MNERTVIKATDKDPACGYCEKELAVGDEVVLKEDVLAEPEYGDDPYFFVCSDCE